MDGWAPWLIGIGVVVLVIGWVTTRRLRGAGRPSPAGRKATRPKGSGPARTRRRPPVPRPGSATRAVPAVRPRAGEIWWADVPYEDGTGSKLRPCLVLRIRQGGADVLKITSRPKDHRPDHVRLPTSGWDPRADRDSFLDLAAPIRVTSAAFTRRAGACDRTVWWAVRRLHRVRT